MFRIAKTVTEGTAESTSMVPVDIAVTDGLFDYIVFKDTTNGKKYKLQVTNGAIELVEVT